MTTKELNALVTEFKKLVELDTIGITSSDARRTVATWLIKLDQPELADKFEVKVLAYQNSKKIEKMQEKADSYNV